MTTHESILQAIEGVSQLSTEQMELAAIWLDKPLQMEGKRSIKIAPGDRARVFAGQLINCHESDPDLQATHIVTHCRGTIYSTLLEVEVRDMKTNEVLTIKL